MLKLICPSCGFANPIKSEFMTFCESCGKKLPNNFQEWKKFNPGKSFNDYKTEVGTDEETRIQNAVKQKRKINIGLVIGLVIGILLITEGYYMGITGYKNFKTIIEQKSQISDFEDSVNWRLMEDKAGNFKIRFPGNAVKDIQTEEMGEETIYIVSYMLETDPEQLSNLLFGAQFLKYPDGLMDNENIDYDGFFESVINGSVNSVGGELKSISKKDYQNYPGRIATVNFQNGMAEITYWDILVGNTIYILQTISPAEKAGNEFIDRFFDSFELLSN